MGIGKIRSSGQRPVVEIPDDVDSDYSQELIRTGNSENSPKIHMQHTNKSRRSMTHNACASGTTTLKAETMIRRAVTNRDYELYHALNKGIFCKNCISFYTCPVSR